MSRPRWREGVPAALLLVVLWLAPALLRAEPASDAAAGADDSPGQTADAADEHRWHTARRSARRLPRDSVEADPDDWNPLARPTAAARAFLARGGITSDLFVAFVYQWASEVRFDGRDFGSFAYRSTGDLALVDASAIGASFLEWNLNGSVAFGFDERNESLAGGFQIGDLSIVDTNVYPDGSAVDELFWKQVIADGRWVVLAGLVDQSFHFDLNRVANDAWRNLLGFAFVNNLSIPWPLYGGVGAAVTWKATSKLTLRLGGGESASDEPWRFWQTVDDGSWYQLLEAALTLEVPALGKGTYRLTPWHNHLDGEDGWGVGLNFDQELGLPWLVAFFRFGAGDAGVTPVTRFVSGGVGIQGPFGRSGDLITLGAAWSRPSQAGARDETFLELQYRLQLTPTLELSPDFQLVLNPSLARDTDVVVVPGLRLTLVF